MTSNQLNKRPLHKKILKIFLRIILVVLILFVALVLFIRSPWGQDIIVGKVTDYVSDKIDTEFDIGKLYVTFSGHITLEELYLEDQRKDTLIYSKYLEANIPLNSLIFGNNIEIDLIDWRGLTAKVNRTDTVEGFNFQYFINAFSSSETPTNQASKDTTTTQFSLGKIQFSEFDLSYKDEVTGIDAHLILDDLKLESNAIDLEQMKFDLDYIQLKNTTLNVIQSSSTVTSTNEETSELPWILIDDLSLEQIEVSYQSVPEQFSAETVLHSLSFSGLDANIDAQQLVLERLDWTDSQTKIEMNTPPSGQKLSSESKSQNNSSFSWPAWQVDVNEIDLRNQQLEFYQNGNRPTQGEFSPQALAFSGLNLNMTDVQLTKNETAGFQLHDFKFKEASGIHLKQFEVNSSLTSQEIQLEDLRLRFNNSVLFADLALNYMDLSTFIASPAKSEVSADVKTFEADIADAFVFSQELKSNKQLKQLATHPIKGDFKANGNLKDLTVTSFNLNWGTSTSLQLEGSFKNLDQPEQLGLSIDNLQAKSSNTDLSVFLSEENLGVALPEQISVSGSFRKDKNFYNVNTRLNSTFGAIQLQGFYSDASVIDYALEVDISALELDRLLQNEELGNLNMQLSSQGNGSSLNELDAELSSSIDSLHWKAYTFSAVKIKGEVANGKGEVNFDYKDNNLEFDVASAIDLDSVAPSIDLELDLKGIDTQQLGLTSRDIKAKAMLHLKFMGNLSQFQLESTLKDGLVVYDDKPYYPRDIKLSASVDSTMTQAKLQSQFLTSDFKANSSFNTVSKALKRHFKQYTTDSLPSIARPPVRFDLEMDFIDSPLISEVVLDGIQEMDSLQASMHFNEEENELRSSLSLPYLNYQNNEVNGLKLKMNSNGQMANISFGFDNILAEPLDIATTDVNAVYENRQLNLQLDAYSDEKDFFSSSVTLQLEEDELYRLRVSPENLVLNGAPWTIPASNEMVYHKDSLIVKDFKLSRNAQQLKLSNDFEFENNPVGIVFENFNLSTIINYLNPNEKLANGELSGRLVLVDPFVSNGLIANLNIDNLKLTEVPLGNLSLTAEANSEEEFKLGLQLKDKGINLGAEGLYLTNAEETLIDLNFDLNRLEMVTLQQFAPDLLMDSKGILSGNFKIEGSPEALDYDGFLAFNEVEFNLKPVNTLFKLQQEKIMLTKDNLRFDDFTLRDRKGNTLVTDGSIDIKNVIDPIFDLTVKASDFQLLNSTAEDNDLYYGQLIFDTRAAITGELSFPKVDLDLTIKKATDLTYIIPESRASIEEREGVVVFVNKENPDDILTQQDKEAFDALLTGVDLSSAIKIEKESAVKIIFNKRTGDNVAIQGGGDFKFGISRTGKMNLAGKYNVLNGSVELNLYNIVKRKFDISSASSVTWTGDPYNAQLDLRAIYNVEAAASALMATQTAGENASIQNRYKQQLPFQVYLDIDGQLTSPDLSFALDMPENERGAINGSVYARLMQVNQQKDELNNQVFSLLVLNRFYPNSGSDGSQGGPATMARDNLNQALSDQLNAFSDKLTGNTGISLNFDVNSYTDYQGNTAQDRTDLDVTAQKKLLDDRLVVRAGSSVNVQGDQRPGESQSVVGNVNVEYLLTEDGRWKLRGFRKSEYENVIDGQVFVSGIALIFTREFNKFKVLWDKAYRESLKEDEVEIDAQDAKKNSADNDEN